MSLQLTFRRMAHSVALATHVRRRAEKLEHVFGRIVSCHVVIDLAGHHHCSGTRCRVSINLALPGRELLVSRAPADEREAESTHASTDRAFDEAERQLEDWVRRRRAHRHEVRRSA